jgi:hypothetical protein
MEHNIENVLNTKLILCLFKQLFSPKMSKEIFLEVLLIYWGRSTFALIPKFNFA